MNLPIIDAHHHLWDLGRVHYPWLEDKGGTRFFGQPDPIRRNYLPEDYVNDHNDSIIKSVHIQVGCIPEHNEKETALIQDFISDGAPIGAIVAAVDVTADNLEQQLTAQQKHSHVKGVRHMIGKSPCENHLLPEFNSAKWISGWRQIAQRELSFDLQLTEEQYHVVYQALRQVPELNVTICHFASPWDQSETGFQRWREAMVKFASLPNCYFKLSGFVMFNFNFEQKKYLEYAMTAIKLFGAERCMLGSNFPVDKLHMSFDELKQSWQHLTTKLENKQAAFITYKTAQYFYRFTI